ncbi:MAG: DUF4185 domain-containing protein [Sandaracinaceae bacterium]|nr:DUF4185 domain-containing protein [Sandaracinaceae bacterium]
MTINEPEGPSTARPARAPLLASILWLGVSGCYGAHERGAPPPPCGLAAPTCVTRDAPCDPLRIVNAACVGETWACPEGASVYERPFTSDRCLPLFGHGGGLIDGVHEAPVPVPIGDRCAWVMPGDDGVSLAFVDVAPSCEELGDAAPLEVDPSEAYDYLALAQSLALPSGPAVLVRGWVFDPAAAFGVRGAGVGLSSVGAVRLGSPLPWLFGEDDDLGDAALVWGDHVYAYGCPGVPHDLLEDCHVGRAPLGREREPSAWEIFGEGGWGVGTPVVVFGSGPHRGPVVADPRGGLVHLYAVGFGSTIELTRAERPEGPWSPPTTLVPCELPADDPDAYCAGPIVHLELFDPTRPDEIVVSYAIGTTASDGAERRARSPERYWPRVVRVAW